MDEFNEGVERVTAGLEKKQRIMHEDEKQRVAYHESGHALVAYSLPNTDPVHKVSIIPRGLAALGYTMQRPEGDRYLMTQARAGKPHPGAAGRHDRRGDHLRRHLDRRQNDLERATEIARSMVMEFGMSRLGRVNYRESNRSPFLAMAARRRNARALQRADGCARSTRKCGGSSTRRSKRSGTFSSRAAPRSKPWPSG